MIILGIESSCDETAAAILKDGQLLSNVVVSQIDIFKAYGGVIPEVAARSHLEAILPVIDKALADANVAWEDIDAIAVTHTPGLLGSLLIGTLTARTLAILHNKPLYAVHHLKSHIYSNWLERKSENTSLASEEIASSSAASAGYDRGRASAAPATAGGRDLRPTKRAIDCKRAHETAPEFPLLALVISGGHTQIIYMKEHNSFEIIGTTLDDAVGECFDKVAKILGLPYPGGPSIAKAAEQGDPKKYRFPHPKIDNLNFSFSGLKTAVLRAVQKECGVGLDYPSHDLKNLLNDKQIADFAASFQKTAVDILLEKLKLAKREHPDAKSIVFAGGVSANKALRNAANEEINFLTVSKKASCSVLCPSPQTPAVRNTTITKRVRGDVVDECRTDCCISDDCAERTRTETELEDSPAVYFPAPEFSGDNAAMVAMAYYYEIQSGVQPTDPYSLDISPRSIIS